MKVESTDKLNHDEYDSVIIVGDDLSSRQLRDFVNLNELKQIKEVNRTNNIIKSIIVYFTFCFSKNHKEFDKDVTFIVSNNKRIIYSPVGPLDRDYDDVRRVAEATNKAFKK